MPQLNTPNRGIDSNATKIWLPSFSQNQGNLSTETDLRLQATHNTDQRFVVFAFRVARDSFGACKKECTIF